LTRRAAAGYALPVLHLFLVTLIPPIAVWLLWWTLRERGLGSETLRRVFVFLELAAVAVPFVIGIAWAASIGGKAIVGAVFFGIAVLPVALSRIR
jgi:hypothetical protein